MFFNKNSYYNQYYDNDCDRCNDCDRYNNCEQGYDCKHGCNCNCCCRGERGPRGFKGEKGEQGIQGIQGERGEQGSIILGHYDTVEQLRRAQTTGEKGDSYLVGEGELYIWGETEQDWVSAGSIRGPQGEQGIQGIQGIQGVQGEQGIQGIQGEQGIQGIQGEQGIQGIQGERGEQGSIILGHYDTVEELRQAQTTGEKGDSYLVGEGELYIWDETEQDWVSAGSIRGPQGEQGIQGIQGERGEQGSMILGHYDTIEELREAHSTGNKGEAYIVGDGELYIWDETEEDWVSAGSIKGPEGEKGETGDFEPNEVLFTIQTPNGTAEARYQSTLEIESNTLDITAENETITINAIEQRIYQFNSVNEGRVQSGISGGRSTFCAIGMGSEEIVSTSDPVILMRAPISVKLLDGGKLTDLVVTVSLALSATDFASTLHAQLYYAHEFNAREFFPVENTAVAIDIPYGSAVGTVFLAELHDLDVEIPDNCQLVIGFYNTSTATAGLQMNLGAVAKIVG